VTPAVDVVVVAYRSRRHLAACLEPLVGRPELNLVVVDNDCPERSGEIAAALGATVLRNERNVGFGAACNRGAAAGGAPAILLLNPDAVIQADGVAALAARLDADPGLGAVGPRLDREDGSTERSIGRAPRAVATLAEALYVHRIAPSAEWASEFAADGYDREQEVEWLVGACLCVRRADYEAIGGFDERFFLYGEDVDLCLRLRERGKRVLYDPAVVAIHHGSGSGSRLAQAELVTQGRVVCARLHTHGASYAGLRAAIALHDAIRLPVSAARGRAVLRSRLRALGAALRL
jgi:GT2 family glycosyltransferase